VVEMMDSMWIEDAAARLGVTVAEVRRRIAAHDLEGDDEIVTVASVETLAAELGRANPL
jgi:hypothetical protein